MDKKKLTIGIIEKEWTEGHFFFFEFTFSNDVLIYSIATEFMKWVSERRLRIHRSWQRDGKFGFCSDQAEHLKKAKEFFREKGLIQ